MVKGIEYNGLKLRADFVAHTLCKVDKKVDRRRIVSRAAERVKAVALDLIEERLKRRGFARPVGAAGKRDAGSLRQIGRSLERNEAVIPKPARRRCGLRVDQGRAVISRNVIEFAVVRISGDNGFKPVAGRARISCRAIRVRRLRTAAVEPVCVQGLRVLKKLAQREHFGVGVRIAKNPEAVLLEVAVCHGEDFIFGSPVQHERHSRVTALGERCGSL